MSELPPIGIIITTYERTDLAIRTIEGIKKYLTYSKPLFFHIADDGSSPGPIQRLLKAIGPDYEVTVTNAERKGVGYSMNIALKQVWEKTSLVLILEDDWLLTAPLNLDKHALALTLHSDEYGIVRHGYLSTGIKAHLVGLDGHCWWELEKGSHQYWISGQVSLRNLAWYQSYGYHVEGVSPGQQEISYCLQCELVQNGPKILWPPEFGDYGPWKHIGGIGAESLNSVVPKRD